MSTRFETPIAPLDDEQTTAQAAPIVERPRRSVHTLLRNKQLLFLLRLSCTLLLFGLLFKSISWPDILQKLNNLDDGGLLIGVVVGLFGVIISAYQWQSLLDVEQMRIDLRRLINLYLVGIAFNHFLPTGMGGDIVKAYYVGKEGQNHVGSVSAVVMSRLTGFVGMLLVSVPTLLIAHSMFNTALSIAFLLSILAMCCALALIFCLATFLPRIIPARWQDWSVLVSCLKVGRTMRRSMAHPRTLVPSILFGSCFHLVSALNYYSYAQVLHIPVSFGFYLLAIPFVSLIAFLPISINGFGLREGALAYIFATAHVPVATAVSLALLIDVQSLLMGALGGGIYLVLGKLRHTSTHHTIQPAEQS